MEEIKVQVILGNAANARDCVLKAVNQGIAPEEILFDALVPGIHEVGVKFSSNRIFLQEVLICVGTMKAAVKVLKPLFTAHAVHPIANVVIGTVKGDLHALGKELVKLMMTTRRLKVIDLGTNVSENVFLESFYNYNPKIIAISAFLTSCLNNVEKTIVTLDRAGIRIKVKIMVGGGAVSESFSTKVRADGYAPNAHLAVEKALDLLDAP